MSRELSLLVIGAGLAGAKAVEGARAAGFAGRAWLVGEEPDPPYERPPLSKDVLRGERPAESTRVHEDGYYAEHGIELVLADPVDRLDVGGRRATLRSGRTIGYDVAVLATGSEPRRLGIPGSDLPGVHRLRTSADAELLAGALRTATRVAVIGAGWIGSEVASSARSVGVDVVMVDPAPLPLVSALGSTVATVFRDLHADHGVALRPGRTPVSFRGHEGVEEVVLDDGSAEPADVVVVGVGAVPRTALAVEAGLDVRDGVLVDSFLRTSAPHVLAAGDVARAWHPRFQSHLRVEHWTNALHQGLTAGSNAVSGSVVYDRLPYFFSDQYDLGLEYVGHARPGSTVTVRGDLRSREFVALYSTDGEVTAALAVNTWGVLDELKAVVAGQWTAAT